MLSIGYYSLLSAGTANETEPKGGTGLLLSEKCMEIGKKLLDIGKRDLESAIALFKEKHFNTAIFQFQQSVEKCVKSYGIVAGVIEEKDLARKISHLPHKVFARLFKKSVDELERKENHFSYLRLG